MSDLQQLAAQLVEMAARAGAHSADALCIADTSDAVQVRHGKIESVEQEDSRGIGLRAFLDKPGGLAFASASSSDVSSEGLSALVEQVMAMAKVSEADPDAMPPLGAEHPDGQQLADWEARHTATDSPWELDAAREAALAAEEAALARSPEISNSEGAESAFGRIRVAYASSDGFAGAYQKTSASLSVSVIAGKGDGMQRDYAWDRQLISASLRDASDIGREAADRAAQRLGAAGMASGAMPVIFEPRVASSLLGHLSSAINGRAVLQQRSFLADAMGEIIFPDFINITDDPDHPEGLGNRLFDGEGSRCRKTKLVEAGRLGSWLTDRYAAGRLKCAPGGHARRGLSGDIGIGTSNIVLTPGTATQQQMLDGIGDGLLVTELIGFGVNGVTGDYSRGASGFVIENGRIGRPVQEITIAGNLRDMFRGIRLVGSDLTWFGTMAVASIAIDGMTVAGQG